MVSRTARTAPPGPPTRPVADLAMLLGCWEDDDIDQVLAGAAVLAGQE